MAHILFVEVFLQGELKGVNGVIPENRRVTYAEFKANLGELLLQRRQLITLLLGEGKPRASSIQNHLLNKSLLLSRELIPLSRCLDVLLCCNFGVEDIDAHRGFDAKVAHERLSLVGGITELLRRRNVLVEGQRFSNLVEVGIRFRECFLGVL